MTSRQRFRETMHYGAPDRIPYFEEGIRKDVIRVWHQQGLSPKTNIYELFPTDHFNEVLLDVDPHPEFKVWPQSLPALDLLDNRLDPDDPSRFPKGRMQKLRFLEKNDRVQFIRVHRGFFLTVGASDWPRFTDVLSLIIENPEYIRKMMMIQGEFAARLTENVLEKTEVDAAIFSEPIGGNEGPLISPVMYEEFVLKSYQPLLNVLKKNGINTIIMRTYANTRILIPSLLKYGFNCLWACETNIEQMDYRDLRRKFGRDLRLIGGIDLDALRHDKESIRREVEEKVPHLVADGGYIPLVDGRIRQDVLFDNYVYYRRLLEEHLQLSRA
jgi:uroporphyrinogen decarboxylase